MSGSRRCCVEHGLWCRACDLQARLCSCFIDFRAVSVLVSAGFSRLPLVGRGVAVSSGCDPGTVLSSLLECNLACSWQFTACRGAQKTAPASLFDMFHLSKLKFKAISGLCHGRPRQAGQGFRHSRCADASAAKSESTSGRQTS